MNNYTHKRAHTGSLHQPNPRIKPTCPIESMHQIHHPNLQVDAVWARHVTHGRAAVMPVPGGDVRSQQHEQVAHEREDARKDETEYERVEYTPNTSTHRGARAVRIRPGSGGSTAGSAGAAASRPQTAPVRREETPGAQRLRVAPDPIEEKKRPTTIRLTATGCFRNANRPASATSWIRPGSAGGGGRVIPGLTRPWSGKQRWASDKELVASQVEDAVSLANRRKRGHDQKVFILSGPFKEVRDALLRRFSFVTDLFSFVTHLSSHVYSHS